MIDLHSHILPGIDDGSRDVEMSQKMLEKLAAQGVTALVATPHFYAASDNPEAFLDRRQAALAQLGQTVIPVLAGAEVAYFDGMSRSNALTRLCLGTTRYLLVEMPYGTWSQRMVQEVCDLPVQQGVIPVLAHVDRYREQFQKFAGLFAGQGIPAQINADAFLSWRTRGWALRQVQTGNVHFLGSDSHNLTTRPPRMDEAKQVITKKLGAEVLEEMTRLTAEILEIQEK